MRKLTSVAICLIFGCSKAPKCETWEFWEECISKKPTVYCYNRNPPSLLKGTFCDEKLKGVYVGSEVVIADDENHTTLRHFTREIR